MKKIILFILLLFINSTLIFSQEIKSYLWEIKAPKSEIPSYILGVLDNICPEDFNSFDKYLPYLDKCGTVGFLNDENEVIKSSYIQELMHVSTPLSKYFNSDDYKLVGDFMFTKKGIPLTIISNFDIFLVKQMILEDVYAACNEPIKLNSNYRNLAVNQSKQIVYIDTLEIFKNIVKLTPKKNISKEIVSIIKDSVEYYNHYREFVKDYNALDFDKLTTTINKFNQEINVKYFDLINKKIYNKIDKDLSNKQVFYVLSINQLLGDKSLLRFLESKGYSVKNLSI